MELASYLESKLFDCPQFQLQVKRDNQEQRWHFYSSEGIVYQFVLPVGNILSSLLDGEGKLLGKVCKTSWCGTNKYKLAFKEGDPDVKLSEKKFSFNRHRLSIAYKDETWAMEWSPTLDPFEMEVTWSLTLNKVAIAKYYGNFEPTCHMGRIEFQAASGMMQKLGPALPRAIVLSLGFIAHRQKRKAPF
ncbi:hypothetical protein DSO57_1013621 [Entomophthora muscae]|uniref:Uncharacterized protein n=1 Tax=Entomophthora muscae TaxID=34485 RepID=A0ACC2SIE3_9FUNG|nr:hypothetical protein DSO57_1013621 [Entomophthora muscae]